MRASVELRDAYGRNVGAAQRNKLMHFSHLMPLGTPMVIFCVSLRRTKKNESLLVVDYYVT